MALPADPLERALLVLCCLAAEPRLGGVLFLDLDPSLLPPLGYWLADHMAGRDASGVRSTVHVVGSHASEEDLWLRTALTDDGFDIVPGLLVEDSRLPAPIILLPDLCRASVFTARAAVTTIAADDAAAERLGQSRRWRPRALWLAAADRVEAGTLSAHLLDRFPVRVNAGDLRIVWHLAADLTTLADQADEAAALRAALPSLPGAGPLPSLNRMAADHIIATVPTGPSRRRDLALGRVARALAARASAPEVTAIHVTDAASLLGITPSPDVPQQGHTTDVNPATTHGDLSADLESPPPSDEAGLAHTEPADSAPVAHSGPGVALEPLEIAAESLGLWPYPEDHPDALPSIDSLMDFRPGRSIARRQRGRQIGIQRASDLHDIAIVATLLEAAKFQRHRGPTRPGRLVVSPEDLRKYRRRPEPAAALVLVLDHSCWHGWDWGPALAPYLRWAYQENAAVSVIEFGQRGGASELRAEGYRAGSLLDTRVTESLDRPPGLASPLAHALDLAVQELHRCLRGASCDDVVLAIATDGRGNVPLEASLRGSVPHRVGRSGVLDALTIATAVRTMNRVRAVVITPDIDQYAELPFDLADAMDGAVIVATRRTEQAVSAP